jgi:hypothetical protein
MNLLWAAVILVAANAATIGAMLLVRRRAPDGSFFADGDRASGVFGVLATGFAIFAGFVIFLAFTQYDDSRSGAETEALAVVQLYETAQFLPTQTRDALSSDLVCYARYVVEEEWPRMREGAPDETLNPWGVAMFRTLQAARARTSAEQSAYDRWHEQTSTREEARRDRLHGAAGIIPDSIWLVLFLTAGVVFAYMLFFADSGERARSQAMLMGSATTVVVATLLAIVALDNPYRSGVGSLEPIAMERTLDILAEVQATLGEAAPPPCDGQGAAQ